ncbi:pre T-cell antigen receptor alpha [Amia ocellicauda]|uniref:pre T-cell antigen receptor alpha n=1 Tax=Amia ocellicauda TaxID=2972642 RepID=UPI003463E21C
MLLCILILQLVTIVGVEADIFATVAPPIHSTGGGGGRTLLVCLVSDFLHTNVEVTWLSNGTEQSQDYVTYSVAKEDDGTHSAVSLLSVDSNEWDLYTCFVNYRRTTVVVSRQYTDIADEDLDDTCYEGHRNVSEDIHNQSDAIFILALRLLLLKSTIFNFLLTMKHIVE